MNWKGCRDLNKYKYNLLYDCKTYHIAEVFENKALRRKFEHKREEKRR